MKYLFLLLLLFNVGVDAQKINWKCWGIASSLQMGAGFFNQSAEIIQSDYRRFKRVFPNVNEQWWNPKYSFKNKYKDWPRDTSPKYWGATNVLAWTTDFYHCSRTISNVLAAGSVAVSIPVFRKKGIFRKQWKNYALQATTSWLSYSIGCGIAELVYHK